MWRFVIGDVHGRHKALVQVLKLCRFDYEKDLLICLGDLADGGSETYEVVEELLKIKNIVLCLSNHDFWLMQHVNQGFDKDIWLSQGGLATKKSYSKSGNFHMPVTHQDFFNHAVPYYILDEMIFVHGGFNPKIPIGKQKPEFLMWDRDLIKYAREHVVPNYDKVFVGHTHTSYINKKDLPVKRNNLWALDTGAGWSGRLTIMNIDTEQYWQSDKQKPPIDYE